ncbi:hypothetical protein [Luteitalea pratensis]|nr:hypothetical protein [Luteitalea pratensis]
MTSAVADDDAMLQRDLESFKDLPLVPAHVPASAHTRSVPRGQQRPGVSPLGSQRSRQESGGAGANHTLSIAVYDASPDRRRLLAATLYGLGCRTVPLDCESDAPEFLRAQLVASRPDVVIWQIGSAPHDQGAPLLRALGSGTLADIGVVVTTPHLAHATAVLGPSASMVRMLATPFSLGDLMRAVSAAHQDSVGATHG